jgi:streptogramin lyase
MRKNLVLRFSLLLATAILGAIFVAGCGSGGTAATTPTGPVTPTLTISTVAPQNYGNPPVVLSAKSSASDDAGAVTYALVSGPGTLAGNTVTITGVGTIVVTATQAASGNYTSATASVSISVGPAVPTLVFAAIPVQAFGSAPFTVSATSVSSGAVTYSVSNGPATISGNTVTLTGVGTVVLTATQAAAGNYAATTAQTSFVVQTGVTKCPTSGTLFCGLAQAGGVPVSGASVQLYAAGTSGNGSAATALTTAITTDANGTFIVPSTLSCPSASRAVYVVSKGGKAGTGSANSALWLMAPMGACSSMNSSTTVTLNELSTVASAATLAQFYANGGNVGATATNALGLANAMATEQVMVNLPTGVSPSSTTPANVTVNSAKLNSLAEAFSGCAVSSSACGPLFAAATVNGTVPGNTLDAAFNIARNPASNVAAIFALATGTTFAPTLTVAPPDWMMFLTIGGGGMNSPTALALDSFGNAWSANYNEVLSEFTPNGAAVFANGITGSGLHESYGMAIDAANNVWVENDETPGSPNNGGTIAKFANNGTPISSGIGYTAGIYFPTGIASDLNGDMWIANYGNSSYALYTNAGAQIACPGSNACGYGYLEFPVAVAADANHFAWFANQSANTVTRVSLDGTSLTSITCCNGASGVAVDQKGNVWVANYFGDSISELTSAGGVVTGSPYTGGSQIVHPQGIAVDGAGSIWVANYRGGSMSELAGANAASPGSGISPTSGYGSDAGLIEPYALAIDASGNVWISNYAMNTLVEFVGVAVPVKTPLVGPPTAP